MARKSKATLQAELTEAQEKLAHTESENASLKEAVSASVELIDKMGPSFMEAQVKELTAKAMNNMPQLANWALVNTFKVKTDGLTFQVTPSYRGRTRTSETEIDWIGDDGKTTTTTTSRAKVKFSLPFFNEVLVDGIITHTEITSPDSELEIKNQVTFSVEIQGVTRKVTVETSGEICTCFFAICPSVEESSAHVDKALCSCGCGGMMPCSDAHDAEIEVE